jgi:hypothetical protein
MTILDVDFAPEPDEEPGKHGGRVLVGEFVAEVLRKIAHFRRVTIGALVEEMLEDWAQDQTDLSLVRGKLIQPDDTKT